jgi:hypothetical protein
MPISRGKNNGNPTTTRLCGLTSTTRPAGPSIRTFTRAPSSYRRKLELKATFKSVSSYYRQLQALKPGVPRGSLAGANLIHADASSLSEALKQQALSTRVLPPSTCTASPRGSPRARGSRSTPPRPSGPCIARARLPPAAAAIPGLSRREPRHPRHRPHYRRCQIYTWFPQLDPRERGTDP